MESQEPSDYTVPAAILVEYTVTAADVVAAGKLTKVIANAISVTLDDVLGTDVVHAHAFISDAAGEITEARRRILADDATF
jgi:hypothetical protein